jgi:hypothetical protein
MKKNLFQNFSLFSPVSLTRLINIHSRISPRLFEKKNSKLVLMGCSGARGTLIYGKNLMSKISCQTPFKVKQQHYCLHASGSFISLADEKMTDWRLFYSASDLRPLWTLQLSPLSSAFSVDKKYSFSKVKTLKTMNIKVNETTMTVANLQQVGVLCTTSFSDFLLLFYKSAMLELLKSLI